MSAKLAPTYWLKNKSSSICTLFEPPVFFIYTLSVNDSIKETIMNKDMTYEQLFAISRDRIGEIMKEVFEKCKNDKKFEQVMLNDPTGTLKKEGLELQPGISFQIVKTMEDAKLLPNNIIPLYADAKHLLTPEELDVVAAGLPGLPYLFDLITSKIFGVPGSPVNGS
jgi:hypothetical protein